MLFIFKFNFVSNCHITIISTICLWECSLVSLHSLVAFYAFTSSLPHPQAPKVSFLFSHLLFSFFMLADSSANIILCLSDFFLLFFLSFFFLLTWCSITTRHYYNKLWTKLSFLCFQFKNFFFDKGHQTWPV